MKRRVKKENAENSSRKRVRIKKESIPKKRKRIKSRKQKSINDKQLLICNRVKEGQSCWYKGPCPHRKPHKHIVKKGHSICEEGFCSYMKLNTGCVPIKEK